MIAKCLLVILVTYSTFAAAQVCSILSPPIVDTAEEIAEKGVMLKGRIVQSFDLATETPEIIEVEQVYVGDEFPKAYVIYRPRSEFEAVRKFRDQQKRGAPPPPCEPFFNHKVENGQMLDRLVLMPAPAERDQAATGRWVFHRWNGNVSREQGLDMLLQSANRRGRLRSRPSKLDAENCRECAPANP